MEERGYEGDASFGIQELLTLRGMYSYRESGTGVSKTRTVIDDEYTYSVPPGKWVHVLLVFSGTASDWRTSKWGLGGYKGDGIAVAVDAVPGQLILALPMGTEWDGRILP